MYQPHFIIYIAEGEEYCVYSEKEKRLVVRHDPFPGSLLEFLYLDADALAPHFAHLERQLRRIAETRSNHCASVARQTLQKLGSVHPYLSFVEYQLRPRITWALTADASEVEEFLRQQELTAISAQIKNTQRMILNLLDHALDGSCEITSISERLAVYRNRCLKDKSECYHFRPLTINYDVLDEHSFAEFVRPNSVFDIVDFFTRECITREVKLRKCKNCGRYFALTGHQGTEYCDRVVNDRGQTCREVGAAHVWEKTRGSDEVFREYRREYKKRFAWIRAGRIDPDSFYAWGEKARAKKEECDSGEITLGEFHMWLIDS